MVGLIDPSRLVMEGALRRLAADPAREALVLRGGLLASLWFAPAVRRADDLDFLALFPSDPARAAALIASALARDALDGVAFDVAGLRAETIFAETESPGARLRVPVTLDGEGRPALQIDVGFGDPLARPPSPLLWPALRPPAPGPTLAVDPECAAAWKLHGLFEFPAGRWRPKDLYDLYLFSRQVPLDAAALRASIALAFESRGTPLAAAWRLLDGRMGQSPGSRAGWRRFRRARPGWGIPEDLGVALEAVAAFARPHLRALLPGLIALPPGEDLRARPRGFPLIEHLDDVLPAIRGRSEFQLFRRDGVSTLTYEVEARDSFPDPARADGAHAARVYALRRACRGLTFDHRGRVIARALHVFFELGDRPETRADALPWDPPPEVLEKLDGAMIAPLVLGGEVIWTTRRGRSDIAERAGAHARAHPGDYEGLARALDQAGQTPIFEWCSRRRRAVIDHPVSRLVLLAVRERRTGAYLPSPALAALADARRLPAVRSMGPAPTDPAALAAQVRARRGAEGVILRWPDGHMVTIKTDWYRRLRRLREDPWDDRALLAVAARGEVQQVPLPPERAAEARALEAAIEGGLATRAAWLEGVVGEARAIAAREGPAAARKAIATGPAAAGLAPRERRLIFDALDGGEARAVVEGSVLRWLDGRGGAEAVRRFLGLA